MLLLANINFTHYRLLISLYYIDFCNLYLKKSMTSSEILIELEKMGTDQTKKTFMNHGAVEPIFGVKVGDLKTIQKKVKKNHVLALELYATGNSDAMYLAGLIADEKLVTKAELQLWLKNATWYMLSEYTVAWLASESRYGWELGLEWIESKEDKIAACGWNALSNWMALQPDEKLDIPHITKLLERIEKKIHAAQNREKYCMNGFVIATGAAVAALTDKCLQIGNSIGAVYVDVGKTSCQVPLITPYLEKIIGMGKIGKKKKMARC
jgi:3-methyladenine DNA glycosylase AlkD